MDGICLCPTGTSPLNGVCVTRMTGEKILKNPFKIFISVPPNSACSPAVECGGGSKCEQGICIW